MPLLPASDPGSRDESPIEGQHLKGLRAYWLRIGTSCDPADRAGAEDAISAIYRRHHRPPPRFLWCLSPLAALTRIAHLARIPSLGSPLVRLILPERDAAMEELLRLAGTLSKVPAALRLSLAAPIERSLCGLLRQQMRSWPWSGSCLFGQHEVPWVAACQLAEEVLGLRVRAFDPGPWVQLARSCGWWWPFAHICVVCERPLQVGWDEAERVHRVDGPAIRYRDGRSIYAWHGVPIPGHWVVGRLDARTLFRWPNQEQRQVAFRVLGWERVLREVGAREVHRDQYGVLLRVRNGPAASQVVRVRCPSTARIYFLQVPPEVRTARAAVAWSFGLGEVEYQPHTET